MIIVAITGNAGSGKSTAVNHLLGLGASSISADAINTRLLLDSPFLAKFIEKALDQIFTNTDGSLNTASLRQTVFSSVSARNKLEQIMHPVIMDNIELHLSLITDNDYCLVELPLLFEANLQDSYTHILLITASQNNLASRLCDRPGITPQSANSILDNQLADSQKFKHASDIVLNNKDQSDLFQYLNDLHSTLTKHRDAHS